MHELFRTKHSKHIQLDNGQIEATIQNGMNYLNKQNDKYEEYDGIWDLTEKDTFGIKIKKADHNLRIYKKGQNKKLKFGFDKNIYIEYGLPDIEESYNGNVCTFTNAWTNTDIQLTVTPEGIKNDILLKSEGHPADFSFPINTNGCSVQKEGNTIVFYKNGEIVGQIPSPFAEDANGNIGEVALDYDGVNVRFIPNPLWISSATYPIIIDPTTVLQPDNTTSQDGYINNFGANANAVLQELIIAARLTSTSISRTLIKFPISIPAGSIVSSSIMELTITTAFTIAHQHSLHRVTQNWDKLTLTWNNQPTFNSTPILTQNALSPAGTWESFDVTSEVQNIVNSSVVNYGWNLQVSPETPLQNGKGTTYASSRYTSDVTRRPKLTITYTIASNPTSVFGSINSLGRRLVK